MVVELRKRRQECTDFRQRIAEANVSGNPPSGFSSRRNNSNFRRDEIRERLLSEVPCRRQGNGNDVGGLKANSRISP
jgi:hypothetical protein